MCGAAVAWASKRERCVTLSSTEAELVAASMAACDLMYIRILLSDLGVSLPRASTLYCDNSGAVAIAKSPLTTTSLKHVLRRHFFVREACEAGEVDIVHVPTADNVADVLTKFVAKPRFDYLVCRLMRKLR